MTAVERIKEYKAINKKSEVANKGELQANLRALGGCHSPEEQKAMVFAMLEDALGEMTFLGTRVFVATYVSPQKTRGGIILPDNQANKSRFEGKCGLVLGIGSMACKYAEGSAFPWEGPAPKVGDWVQYRASDAPEFGFCDVYCRDIDDHLIKAIVKDPSKIW